MTAQLNIQKVEGLVEEGALSALAVELFSREVSHVLLTIQGQKSKPNLIRQITPGWDRLIFDREIIDGAKCLCDGDLTVKIYCLADSTVADQWTGKLVCREIHKDLETGEGSAGWEGAASLPPETEKAEEEVPTISREEEPSEAEASPFVPTPAPGEAAGVMDIFPGRDEVGEAERKTIPTPKEGVRTLEPADEKIVEKEPSKETPEETNAGPAFVQGAKEDEEKQDFKPSGTTGETPPLKEGAPKEGPGMQGDETEEAFVPEGAMVVESASFPEDEGMLAEKESQFLLDEGEIPERLVRSGERGEEEEEFSATEIETPAAWDALLEEEGVEAAETPGEKAAEGEPKSPPPAVVDALGQWAETRPKEEPEEERPATVRGKKEERAFPEAWEEEPPSAAEAKEGAAIVETADLVRKGEERPAVEGKGDRSWLPRLEITEVRCYAHKGYVAEILVEGRAQDCKSVFLKIQWQKVKYFQIVFPAGGVFKASFDREMIHPTPVEPLEQISVTALSIANSAVSDTWKVRPQWRERGEEGTRPAEKPSAREAGPGKEELSERLFLEETAAGSGWQGTEEVRLEDERPSLLPSVVISEVTGVSRAGKVREIVVQGRAIGCRSLFLRMQWGNLKFFQRLDATSGTFRISFDHEMIRSKAKEDLGELWVTAVSLNNPEVSDSWKGTIKWREEEGREG